MDNPKRAAQGTLSEREMQEVASRLNLDRWDDDGGQTHRPQEVAVLVCLADDAGHVRDRRAGEGA